MTPLRQLLGCQWGAVLATLALAWLAGVGAWGAWLPAGAFVVGTALWVWTLAEDRALSDREALKALALGAGVRGGVACGLLAGATAAFGAEQAPSPAQAAGVAIAASLGFAFVLTMLTLIGLDAGRTDAGG